MKIETSIYLQEDRSPTTQSWVCPYCGEGRLVLDHSRLRIEEYEYSKNKHSNFATDNFWDEVESCCAGIMKCNNQVCGELVSFCGTVRVEDIEYDDESSEIGTSMVSLPVITPLFIHPSPHLIKISNRYPQIVKEHLKESFSLFWFDKMSCANKLRVVVEDVLNHFKVKRFNLVKKKRRPLMTHDRLMEFKEKKRYNDPAKDLLAIKWIGNIGSHTGRIDDEVLATGFDLIEKALNILFIKRDEKLRKIREKINKTKGRILKKKGNDFDF